MIIWSTCTWFWKNFANCDRSLELMHMSTSADTHAHTHARAHTRAHAHTRTCTCTRTRTCTHTHARTHTHVRTHTHTHTHTHTRTHAHTHLQTYTVEYSYPVSQSNLCNPILPRTHSNLHLCDSFIFSVQNNWWLQRQPRVFQPNSRRLVCGRNHPIQW